MKYDRCIECQTQMEFYVITSPPWRRWVKCPRCGHLTHADESGMLVQHTKVPPPKHAILRGDSHERD